MPHSTLPLRGLEPPLFMRSPTPNAVESEEDKANLCETPYHLYSVRYMTAIAPNLAPEFQDIFCRFPLPPYSLALAQSRERTLDPKI